MQRYGRFDTEFRGRVVARMKYEGLGPYEMATVLEQEATEDYARRLRIAKKRIGDRAFVDAPVRTPTGQTIERWARGDDSAVRRLRRMMDRIGPVTKHMFAEALELLGWEDGTAAMKLGATPELIRRWRNDADPPSYIAAHVRTLINIVDGRRPRLGWRAEAVRVDPSGNRFSGAGARAAHDNGDVRVRVSRGARKEATRLRLPHQPSSLADPA